MILTLFFKLETIAEQHLTVTSSKTLFQKLVKVDVEVNSKKKQDR